MDKRLLAGVVAAAWIVTGCGASGSARAVALASQAAADRAAAEAAANQAAQDKASSQALASQAAQDKAAAAAAVAAQAAADNLAAAKAASAKAAAAQAQLPAAGYIPPVSTSPATTTPADSFDQQYALTVGGEIVDDIKTVDGRLGDGIDVDGALNLLSQDYSRLENAGIPPGISAADYVSRLRTLASFTDQAANVYPDDPSTGSAKYAVVRAQTKPILDDLNRATGSHFQLPA